MPQSNAYVNPAVVSTDEASDGFVSERSIELPSFTEAGALKVAVGATLAIVTLAVYSLIPPSLSRISPLTVRVPLSSVGQLAVLLGPNVPYPDPPPQSKAYVNPAAVSVFEGSKAPVSDRLIALPSLTEAGALNVAVGATSMTVVDAVYSVNPSSLSMIRPRTVKVPLSAKVQAVAAFVPLVP